MKNTIMYIRQSKDSNDAEESLQGQEFACRQGIEETGNLRVIEPPLRDTITGQAELKTRPAGKELLDALQAGVYMGEKIDAIILPSPDRLSRDNAGEKDLGALLEKLAGTGIVFYFADNKLLGGEMIPFNYEDPKQVIHVKALLGASALERISIADRTMRKKFAMAKKGELVLTGKPPLGYSEGYIGQGKNAVRTFEVNPSEAPMITFVFEQYVAGVAVPEIVTALETEGYTRSGEYWNEAEQTWLPVTWNTSKIYKVLENEMYKGVYVWGKFEYNKKAGSSKKREIGIEPIIRDGVQVGVYNQTQPYAGRFDIEHEPFRIVSDNLWTQAHKRLSTRKRNSKANWLLSGYLFCSCGERMVGNGKYYRCASTKTSEPCGNATVRKDNAEGLAWEALKTVFTDKELLYSGLRKAVTQENEARTGHEDLIRDTQKVIGQTSRKIENLLHSISLTEDPETIELLTRQVEGLVKVKQTQQNELGAHKSTLDTDRPNEAEYNEIVRQAVRDVKRIVKNATFEQKRTLIDKFSKFTWDGEDLQVVVYVAGIS